MCNYWLRTTCQINSPGAATSLPEKHDLKYANGSLLCYTPFWKTRTAASHTAVVYTAVEHTGTHTAVDETALEHIGVEQTGDGALL